MIIVIDGQGGGIGRAIVEKLRAALGNEMEIMALGTNALATAAMLRAGANDGATGENAIVRNAGKAEMIVGSIGIVAADSMHGELTPAMARAVTDSDAKKILIPLNRCNLFVAGVVGKPLPHYIDDAVELIREMRGQDCKGG